MARDERSTRLNVGSDSGLFPDLGIEIDAATNEIAALFTPSTLADERVFASIASSEEIVGSKDKAEVGLNDVVFNDRQGADSLGRAFAIEFTARLAQANALGCDVTVKGDEISVRRRYVNIPDTIAGDDKEVEEDLEIDPGEEVEPKKPGDPAVLEERVSELSLSGELALLPPHKADFNGASIIEGGLNSVVHRVIKIKTTQINDATGEEEPATQYRVALYYRVLVSELEDHYEERKQYALADISTSTINLVQSEEIAGYKEAVMALGALDENGQPLPDTLPLVEWEYLNQLMRYMSLDFSSLRLFRENLLGITDIIYSIQASYEGTQRKLLEDNLEKLLERCFHIGAQSYFSINASAGIPLGEEDLHPAEIIKRRSFIGIAHAIVLRKPSVSWKRKGHIPVDKSSDVPVPHMVITRQRTSLGLPLSEGDRTTFIVPLTHINKLDPRFFEV